MGDTILIISRHGTIADGLGHVLSKYYQTQQAEWRDSPDNQSELPELLTRDGNVFLVILIACRESDHGNILWQQIRRVEGVLVPVIVCGNQEEKQFISRYREFTPQYRKWHRYIEMPWRVTDIMNAIGDMRPLYDDWFRDRLYQQYGHPNLRIRLPILCHNLKGVDLEAELILARYINDLCFESGFSDIADIMMSMIKELEAGLLENVKMHRDRILKLID